jgi:tRNA threonylcarbamoyladenosine biosynthesis protein TsaE
MTNRLFIADAQAMRDLGADLATQAKPGDVIFLHGNLGAGKTTLSRGFLQALGVKGSIKSPTFSLVESYQVHEMRIFHLDLYRIDDPRLLDDIGLEDYFMPDAICLVEWPEKADDLLQLPTYYCTIEIPHNGEGRWVTIKHEEHT